MTSNLVLDWLRQAIALPVGGPVPEFSRSPHWPGLRDQHLRKEPRCQVCGSWERCVPHHCIPVHVDSFLELAPDNLITLCHPPEGGCHLHFGHLWCWRSWNPSVRFDAAIWRGKLLERPK